MNRPFHFGTRALLAAALCAFSFGCTALRPGSILPPDQADDATHGRALTPEALEKVRTEDGELVDYLYSKFWAIPFNLTSRNVTAIDPFTAEAEIESTSFTYNGISPLPFLFLLPVRAIQHQYRYAEAGTPSGEQHLLWHLFWAGAEQKGDWPADRLQLKATGVPIFGSKISVEYPPVEGRGSLFQSLWTFGPAVVNWRAEASPAKGDTARLRLIAPVLLGGPLGLTLWTSADIENNEAKSGLSNEQHLHGPLWGVLGYFFTGERTYQAKKNTNPQAPPVPDPEAPLIDRATRLVLGGFLWMDVASEVVDDPGTRDSRHGPLWSAFGTGRSKGRPTVLFFWFPIPVGGAPAAP